MKALSHRQPTRQWLYARTALYPTLAWNSLLGRILKVRRWWDEIDEHIVLGARPFRRDVPRLANLGVGGIINTCEEFPGLLDLYARHEMRQFHMPTIDFTHPRLEDIQAAMQFIDDTVLIGRRVYVHCKAGRGRSATVVMAYLMTRKQMTPEEAQRLLLSCRPHVNSRLVQRPVVQALARQIESRAGP